MKKVFALLKKDIMLSVSVAAAVAALFITPPSTRLLADIDWKTLATLFMMLTVLEGFKKENIFLPLIRFSSRMKTMFALSCFLVFGVFFTSMFVTNDVSLIIFVPLTILLFRAGDKEKYILPVITFENIAAIRGSMLMPFGSPQNLFLFGKSGLSAFRFMLHMLPLCAFSGGLLAVFISFLFRKEIKEATGITSAAYGEEWTPERKPQRTVYLILFAVILVSIVTRTSFWPYITAAVAVAVFFTDRELLKRTDYVLLLTFLCFFIFSSSVAANENISAFLSRTVTGNEYFSGIILSQAISNVPAAIVLYPFTENLAGLLYGVDTAGLCSVIGSLASVINLRLYVKEYPGKSGKFLKTFTLISWAFFIIVVIPGLLLSNWHI